MKNLDFRSVIIGILSSALMFTFYGMRFQDENLGDIRVKSIEIEGGSLVIKNNKGMMNIFMGVDENGGMITTISNKRKQLVSISSTVNGEGAISTYASDGGELVTIRSTTIGDGFISIKNRHNIEVVNIQGNGNADGAIGLYDRYGDLGWIKSGKQ